MIYKWLFELSHQFSLFNIFQYITVRSFLAFFTAFFVCWFLGPYFIQRMKKKLFSEKINKSAPDTHIKKNRHSDSGRLFNFNLLVCFSFVLD